MKKADTWMPLYIADYLADTSRLTTEQHGAYLLILMDYWRNGPPPDDEAVLASITRLPAQSWRKAAPALRHFFNVVDGKWTQKRIDIERGRADEISSKRRETGKQGASKRWGKDDGKPIANAMANGMANASQTVSQSALQNDTPSPSPTSVAKATGDKSPPDPIFGTGLEFLTAKGLDQKLARSFLGKLRKDAGDIETIRVLNAAVEQDITDPVPWLTRAVQVRSAAPERKPWN